VIVRLFEQFKCRFSDETLLGIICKDITSVTEFVMEDIL